MNIKLDGGALLKKDPPQTNFITLSKEKKREKKLVTGDM